MDALSDHDREVARGTPPEVKLVEALEMMELGLRMKRAALRQRYPEASSDEIDRRFEEWLFDDE